MRSLLGLLPILILVVACPAHRPDREVFYSGDRVTRADYPDVPAVTLLDRTELTLTYSPKTQKPYASALVTRRIQIFDEKGLEYAKDRIPFDHRSRVLWVRARITKPDGRTVDLDEAITVDLPRYQPGSPPAQIYNDDGYKLTKVRGAKPGDVIELQYLRVYRDARWLEPVRVGGALPVKRGEVVIDYPRAYDVDYRVTKLGDAVRGFSPQKLPTRVKGPSGEGEGAPGTRLAFVFNDEPAIYPEELRPAEAALATQVHVQLRGYTLRSQRYDGFSGWDDVAKWYRGLTQGTDRPEGYLEVTLRKHGGKGGSKAQKIRRVQRFLQDHVADVPTFQNLAALPPHGAEAVLRAGIGDAKDQASLGLASLRLMGLDAFPVLVSRLGSFAVVPDLPSPAPFNHVILAVPAGGRFDFIDPSTPALPAGRLPGALQGQRALLVRPDGAQLIDLPIDEPAQNQRDLKYQLSLNRQGMASGSLRVKLQGLDAATARAILRSKQNVAERLRAMLAPDLEIALPWREVLPIGKNAENPNKPLELQFVLGTGEIARTFGGRLGLDLSKITGKPLPQLWRDGRRMPLVIQHPYTARVRVAVSLPDGMGLDQLPAELHEKTDLISIDDRYALSGGKLWWDRDVVVNARTVLPGEYTRLKQPIERAWFAAASPIDVVPGGDRGKSYEGDPF
jgi:hypothetical protein